MLTYKKGSVVQRHDGLESLRRQLRGLQHADPPVDHSHVLTEVLSRDLGDLRGRQSKNYEDQLDAVFCAYLAYTSGIGGMRRQKSLGILRRATS